MKLQTTRPLTGVAGPRRSRVLPPARPLIGNLSARAPHLAPALDGIPGTARPLLVAQATSTNPAFSFGKVDDALSETGRRSGAPMTVDGAVQKTSLLLAVVMATAAITWGQILAGNAAVALGASKVAGVVAMVSALATMFKPQWAPITAPVFAGAKGVALAGFSAFMEFLYPGIVFNALTLTFGVAASMVVAYNTRMIKVTDKFRDGVMMVTGGYFVAMLVGWIASMCGVRLPGLLSGGPIGIGVGLLASGLAAANLLLDLDMIRSAARSRMPKWFEWYSGFSLLLTLVWMYTEVLKLLSMLTGGRDD